MFPKEVNDIHVQTGIGPALGQSAGVNQGRDRTPSEIAFERLGSEIDIYGEIEKSLFERLRPVLLDRPESDVKFLDEPSPTGSPFAQAIFARVADLQRHNRSLQRLLHDLDL
jgi:hypothetical protein